MQQPLVDHVSTLNRPCVCSDLSRTGLYPESHGIIANEFIEPETGAHFFYQHPDESWDAAWWGGEPVRA